MSEVKTESKPAAAAKSEPAKSACGSGCGCHSGNGTKATAQPKGIQNGKGSAPRNMGPRYLSNFDRIKWGGDPSLKPSAGQKAVKVYR